MEFIDMLLCAADIILHNSEFYTGCRLFIARIKRLKWINLTNPDTIDP